MLVYIHTYTYIYNNVERERDIYRGTDEEFVNVASGSYVDPTRRCFLLINLMSNQQNKNSNSSNI